LKPTAQEAEIAAMIALNNILKIKNKNDYLINNLINKFLPHRNIVLKMFVNRR
jgi:hypothetical protein